MTHSAPEFVVIRDIAISWPYYLEAAATLSPLPPHLVLHLAGPTAEGIRVVELWDSSAACRRHPRNDLAELERSLATRPGSVRTLDVTHTLEATPGGAAAEGATRR